MPTAHAEVRACPTVPLFKLYILNDAEVLCGSYPVREHRVTLDGEDIAMWDLTGEDAVLFHRAAEVDDGSTASQYVRQSRMWFDSIWESVARPLADA